MMMIICVDGRAASYGDGSTEHPFCRIEDAQAYIRSLRAAGKMPDGGITVTVKEGNYRLTDGLVFGENDGGDENCQIVYRAEEARKVLLTGGVTLRAEDFVPLSDEERERLYDKSAADRIRKIDLKSYGITKEDIGKLYSNGSHVTVARYDNSTGAGEAELFFGGKRMTLARYPNSDYLRVQSVIDEGEGHTSKRNPKGAVFTYDSETADHVASWKINDDMWTFGYYNAEWSDESIKIVNIDTENKALSLEHYCSFGIKAGKRYYFFNIFEELDAEGEYYIDRDNCVLYFLPPAPLDSEDIVLTITTKSIIRVDNASYLTFKDFDIAYTRDDAIKISGGFDIYETWSNRMIPREAGIADSSHITIDGCRIYAVRQSAVYAHGTNITVKNCDIFNIGTNGIYLSGGDRNTLTPSGNVITNNLIHDWSQYVFTYCGAIGLQGCGCTVSHNEMYNCTHFAVLYLGNDHVVEYNNIHHVCQDTDDCAAIYSGRSYSDRGTVLRYNYIHDVGKEPGEDGVGTYANGIYFDDLMSGQTSFGNILENISGRAFLLGGGREIITENNIIVNCEYVLDYDARGYEGTYENGWYGNIMTRPNTREFERLSMVPHTGEIWSKAYPLLAKMKIDPECSADDPDLAVNPSYGVYRNNVAYPGKNACVDKIADRVRIMSDVQETLVLDDLSHDFPNAANGDYTMSDDSEIMRRLPAFEPIPFEKIGRIKN